MNKRILISFSGGKTSAYMTWCLLHKYKAIWNTENKMFLGSEYIDGKVFNVEILVVFANTSKENDETLDFVNNCDINFGFNTIWIEAVVHKNKGTTYTFTDYKNACRNGDIFESVISKYGIPNMKNPQCTRELKTVPITKLVRDYGWNNGTYDTSIGYRIDEPRRWQKPKQRLSQKKKRHVYYFVDEKPTTKLQVNGWWSFQSFNLELEDHEGNCDMCHKKSENKLIALCALKPKKSEWWQRMQNKYENYTPKSRMEKGKPPYRFYRNNTNIETLIKYADMYFKDAIGNETKMEVYKNALINGYNPKQISLCSESCEPF